MVRDPIKSSARTLQVLELFNNLRRPLTNTDIYTLLEVPQSSATILLKSMVVTGYLNYDRSSRTYFPSSRVAALGDWINHYMFGPGDLVDLVGSVQSQTDEAVAVSAQNDIFVQHLRVVQPKHEFTLSPPEGTMRLLTESASGLVLLSRLGAEVLEKILRHISIYQGRRVDRSWLQEQLDWIREEGFAMMAGYPVEGYAVVAVSLPQAGHRIPLSLAVGGINSRVMRKKSEILTIMRVAVADYSTKLAAGSIHTETPSPQGLNPGDRPGQIQQAGLSRLRAPAKAAT